MNKIREINMNKISSDDKIKSIDTGKSSPSPEPLTPNTQEESIKTLCYAPSIKANKNPPTNINSFKKLKL